MERGHAVAFAGSCPVLLAECRKRKIPVVELEIGKPPVTKWGAISFLWRKAFMRRKLRELLESFGSGNGGMEEQKTRVANKATSKLMFSHLDVLIMLSVSEKLLLTDVAADAGTKVLWVEHDRIGRWLTKNPWLPLLLKQSKKAMTVTVSELSRKMYLELGWNVKRVVAIANGVTLKSDIGKRKSVNGKLRLGCIARLSYEKGVDVLIDAMAKTNADVTLEIVGTGREEGVLQQLSNNLGVDDRITFTTREPNVIAAYNRFDALVLPSRDNDPFGMVAAEAMLAGIPVIVTDECGIAGYLEDGKDALIVKANSPGALADAIHRYRMTDFRSQIAVQGQKTAKEKFSIKTMVQKYEDVLTKASPPRL